MKKFLFCFSKLQKTELFYLNETIDATNALQHGLITKIFNSDVFEAEIVHQTEQIALQSSQVNKKTKFLCLHINGTQCVG